MYDNEFETKENKFKPRIKLHTYAWSKLQLWLFLRITSFWVPSRLSHIWHADEPSIIGLALHEFSVAQVNRAPARCLEGHKFESCRGLRFFLCPMIVTCWSFIFTFVSPTIKFTIFYSFTTHCDIDIADPSGMQDACQIYIKKVYGLALHEFSVAQVNRAPARCLGGHRFEFCWGLRFFLCPVLVTCWSQVLKCYKFLFTIGGKVKLLQNDRR